MLALPLCWGREDERKGPHIPPSVVPESIPRLGGGRAFVFCKESEFGFRTHVLNYVAL